MKKFIYLLSLIVFFGIMSCEKQEIDPGMAPNSDLAGTWTITEYNLDMDATYGPYHLYTYNTSMDEDSIWVDNIYDSNIKVKASADSKTSFSLTSDDLDISETQVIGDSIIFRVTIYNADGSILDDYYEAGHRTTGIGDDTH